MTFTSITPIRLGLKFEPSSIILVYRDRSKLRNRTIPAKNLDILSNITLYVEQFKTNPKHKKYFEKISHNKLEKMFFILQDNMKGYTLTESLERAKKFDTSLNDSDLKSDLKSKSDYDDDFHDTDDDEKNPQSVSTIDEVKAGKNNGLFETLKFSQSQETAKTIDLISNKLGLKSNFYDFEDEVEDEIPSVNNEENDEDESENQILNFAQKTKKQDDEKMETPKSDDESSGSF